MARKTFPGSRDDFPRAHRLITGAVLFEVVLALALFVGAAAVIGTGLHASIQSLDRYRLNTHATDLAVSVFSEMRMGIRSTRGAGERPFAAPFQDWTYEVIQQPTPPNADTGTTNRLELARVEVIVRHNTEPVVRRLSQWLPSADTLEEDAEEMNEPEQSPNFDPWLEDFMSELESAP